MAEQIDLPNVIKTARKERGLSQIEVGDMLGVSAQTVSFWESGKSTPRGSSRLRSLAKILGLRPEELGVELYAWEAPGLPGANMTDEVPRHYGGTPISTFSNQRALAEALRSHGPRAGIDAIPLGEREKITGGIADLPIVEEEPNQGAGLTPAELDIQLERDIELAKRRLELQVQRIKEDYDRRRQEGLRYRTQDETADFLSKLLPENKVSNLMISHSFRGGGLRFTYNSGRTLAMVIQTGERSGDRLSRMATRAGRMEVHRLAVYQRYTRDADAKKYHYVLFLEGSYVPKIVLWEAELFGIQVIPCNSLATVVDYIEEFDAKPTPDEQESGVMHGPEFRATTSESNEY